MAHECVCSSAVFAENFLEDLGEKLNSGAVGVDDQVLHLFSNLIHNAGRTGKSKHGRCGVSKVSIRVDLSRL